MNIWFHLPVNQTFIKREEETCGKIISSRRKNAKKALIPKSVNVCYPAKADIQSLFLVSIKMSGLSCWYHFQELRIDAWPIDESQKRKMALLELATCEISLEIDRLRFEILKNTSEDQLPKPYLHCALEDLTPDSDFLLNLVHFSGRGCDFFYNDTAFYILPSVPSINSMYWCLQHLRSIQFDGEIKIRLDPLIYMPIDEFLGSRSYAMFVYGVPLDWNEIEDIQDDRHCQWMPDPGTISSSKVKFTDLVWSPRHDGIHFVCEEVPQIKTHKSRGGRYLHSIYNPKKKVFYHTDGAIRIYDDNDITLRHESHVRNAGKIGKRIKIFKIDGELERNKWCDIVSSFFVWNEDVKTYFGGKKQSV
ncbi:hypothetical protein IIC38_17835 [candidate division KSB1 bacterium]|nr:hypothetical protein [candidate division KSB1 bacterium]